MLPTLRDLGEFGFIRRITAQLPGDPNILERIGDDCAVVRAGGATLLVTCDAAVEEVHFSFGLAAPRDIGWRIATAAISDIAAMGGRPLFLTVALALPADTPLDRAEGLFEGIADSARFHGAAIIGGDTTHSPAGVFVDITVIGEPVSRYITRAGAKDGDLLGVSGYPGRSAAGLLALQAGRAAPELIEAHLRPQACVREGQWLAREQAVHAMMDVSDGVLQDTGHLCAASGIGADIDPALLPIADALRAIRGTTPESLLLTGGEDYELLVALDPAEGPALCQRFQEAFGLPLTIIGRFTKDWSDARLAGERFEQAGYDHFRG